LPHWGNDCRIHRVSWRSLNAQELSETILIFVRFHATISLFGALQRREERGRRHPERTFAVETLHGNRLPVDMTNR
jgi:hypothetical protein